MGTVFFFEQGSVIFWGSPHTEIDRTLKTLSPFLNSPLVESHKERMKYFYTDSEDLGVNRDIIKIPFDRKFENDQHAIQHKLVFSYCLHQSVKLRDFEERVDNEIQNIKNYPELLVNRSYSFMDRLYKKVIQFEILN